MINFMSVYVLREAVKSELDRLIVFSIANSNQPITNFVQFSLNNV